MTSASAALLKLHAELKAAKEDPDCKPGRLVNIFEYWRLQHSACLKDFGALKERVRRVRLIPNTEKLYTLLMDGIEADMEECVRMDLRSLRNSAANIVRSLACQERCGFDAAGMGPTSSSMAAAERELFDAALKYAMRREAERTENPSSAKRVRVSALTDV